MEFDIWLSFAAASIVLLSIPGPTVLLVISYAIARGRSVALASVAGVAFGDALAMTASLAGLGALLLTSAALFTALKWIGAAYLVWLGIKMLRAPVPELGAEQELPADTEPKASARIFRHTATVTALNPKSNVFFIAFVPQFISPQAPLLPQFGILIATFVALAFTTNLTYALLAGKLRNHLTAPSARRVLARIGGSALVAMGAFTAAFRRVPT